MTSLYSLLKLIKPWFKNSSPW